MAVADAEPPAAPPQTPEQIAETEKVLGLNGGAKPTAPAAATTAIAQKAPVHMGVAPKTVEEGWRLAQFIAQSELVPKGYRGRPADVLVAIQYGMEVGLPPMAALHSIFVTNGRPSLWGDGFLAVIMASPQYKDHDEYYMVEGERREFLVGADFSKDDTMAVCTFWRTDSPRPRTATFSIAKAKRAGLWSKLGPWQEYPDRMLKFRARGFAGHDAFPDVLRGIRTAEEVMDLPPQEDTPPEPPKEVRRISETVEHAQARVQTLKASRDAAPGEQVVMGPVSVKYVEALLGTYTLVLKTGEKIAVPNELDALELEKFKGTDHYVRLTADKTPEGLRLASFGIAE
jgi:hypothetical protein